MIGPGTLRSMTVPEMEKKIADHRAMKNELIGTLYPGILNDEIVQMQEEILRRHRYENRGPNDWSPRGELP